MVCQCYTLAKHLFINFGKIILNQGIKTKQKDVTWVLTALLFTVKVKILTKNITNDVEKWFDTSNYDEGDKIPLPIGKN